LHAKGSFDEEFDEDDEDDLGDDGADAFDSEDDDDGLHFGAVVEKRTSVLPPLKIEARKQDTAVNMNTTNQDTTPVPSQPSSVPASPSKEQLRSSPPKQQPVIKKSPSVNGKLEMKLPRKDVLSSDSDTPSTSESSSDSSDSSDDDKKDISRQSSYEFDLDSEKTPRAEITRAARESNRASRSRNSYSISSGLFPSKL
jgi:hypothetical protein